MFQGPVPHNLETRHNQSPKASPGRESLPEWSQRAVSFHVHGLNDGLRHRIHEKHTVPGSLHPAPVQWPSIR